MVTQAAPFVPSDLDPSRWERLEPLLRALLERPVTTRAEFEAWLVDRSELDAACSEALATRYIDMTCHTEDEGRQRAYASYIESIPPRLKPASFRLDQRQSALAREFRLLDAEPLRSRYAVLVRDTDADVALFREENVPIQTELALLEQKYGQTIGAMSVEFDGAERTLPQMARYLEQTEREVRERAWRAVAERRLRDRDAIDAIFDSMLPLRDRMARQAGCASFVEYAFRSMHRFDYGPDQCLAFHDAVERALVPVVRRNDDLRRRSLGLERLRPWDLAVDPHGRPPLRPFTDGPDLVRRTRAVFDALDPRLAGMFRALGDGTNANGAAAADGTPQYLDLDSRKGKAPGGYLEMRDRTRRPFIFMNAAGVQRDVATMVHEAGHAFHAVVCADEPLLHYRHSPLEFAEVASMSMELLTQRHWGGPDRFYPDPGDARRAARHHLEEILGILAWIATIDAFQHWIYGNPGHSRDARRDAWCGLDARFGRAVDWSGLDDARRSLWHRQLHLFSHPFYYIEYGIAQLGALQLWVRSLDEGEAGAVEAYLRALRLGGSRPLPDLFRAAGLTFDFGYDTIARVADRLTRELDRMPA